MRRTLPLSYWNQNCRPFSRHSPPHPGDADSPRCIAIGKVHHSDLHCPHSNGSDFPTHEMHNVCDTFDLTIKALNHSSPEGFVSLSWMNQSVTASDKKKLRLQRWDPCDSSCGGTSEEFQDDCCALEAWMSNSHCTDTAFTVIWVRNTKRTMV